MYMNDKKINGVIAILLIFSGAVGSMLVTEISGRMVEDEKKVPSDWIEGFGFFEDFMDTHGEKRLDGHHIYFSQGRNTGSMYPVIGDGTSLIFKEDFDVYDLAEGDIIDFKKDVNDSLYKLSVTHRIIEIGYDREGIYFITKGDNNEIDDTKKYGKIRPEQITGVVIGIIY